MLLEGHHFRTGWGRYAWIGARALRIERRQLALTEGDKRFLDFLAEIVCEEVGREIEQREPSRGTLSTKGGSKR